MASPSPSPSLKRLRELVEARAKVARLRRETAEAEDELAAAKVKLEQADDEHEVAYGVGRGLQVQMNQAEADLDEARRSLIYKSTITVTTPQELEALTLVKAGGWKGNILVPQRVPDRVRTAILRGAERLEINTHPGYPPNNN